LAINKIRNPSAGAVNQPVAVNNGPSIEKHVKNIVVEEIGHVPIEAQKVEIVERKGLGHPDTICDLVMNQISIELSQEYLKRVGTILHHNTDKSLLAAGEVDYKFGGGTIKKPMLLVIGDRATSMGGDVHIPVSKIAITTAKQWFKNNIRYLDANEHVKYQSELKHGSAALTDIFSRKGKVLGANDTSAAVGYAPYTNTERIIKELEQYLNSTEFKSEFPATGEDIKIMGMREGADIHITIAIAFLDRFISSEKEYFRVKQEVKQAVDEWLDEHFSGDFDNIYTYINTLDQTGRGVNGVYLTVTGTCADGADCGQVGRGNKVNGLICLSRPQGAEAAAGKNPVSHVGKIYSVLSFRMANEIYDNVSGLKEVYVWLLSQIGRPIDHPKMAAAQVIMENGSIEEVRKEVKDTIDRELGNINKFCMDLAEGKHSVA
jgi:S-adenosylmethionine synthetase